MTVRMMMRIWAVTLGAAIGWGLAGCAEPAEPEPVMKTMAGVYTARSFAIGDDASAVDGLIDGAGMRLVLRADSTSGGTLWLPPAITRDTVRAYDLTGTWSVGDSTVWLVTANGYVKDMVLRRQDATLTMDDVLATKRVRITLAR